MVAVLGSKGGSISSVVVVVVAVVECGDIRACGDVVGASSEICSVVVVLVWSRIVVDFDGLVVCLHVCGCCLTLDLESVTIADPFNVVIIGDIIAGVDVLVDDRFAEWLVCKSVTRVLGGSFFLMLNLVGSEIFLVLRLATTFFDFFCEFILVLELFDSLEWLELVDWLELEFVL